MANRSSVRGVNRAVALLLAVVWFAAGVIGIVFGVVQSRWLLVAIALFAIWYALLWLRVVARSRLLTWRDLAAPWHER